MRAGRAAFLCALVAFGLLGWWGSDRIRREAWTTVDEPAHVTASRELRSGPGVVSNFEHPVVMKVIAAAGLGPARAARAVDEIRDARALFPVLFGLLVVLSGAWAAVRSGPVAGAAVAALVALEPTLRAHAALVHTDCLIALFVVAAGFLLDLADGSTPAGRRLLLASGVVYGVAMVSKYSALPFLAPFAVVAFLRLRRPRRSAGPRPKGKKKAAGPAVVRLEARRAAALALLLIVLPAVGTAVGVQQAVSMSTAREDLVRGIEAQFAGLTELPPALWLAGHLPRGLATYGTGLLWVRASSIPGSRPNYFFGVVSGTGWPAYFTVALAIKLTTAAAVLLFGGAASAAAIAAFARTGGTRGLRASRLARAIAFRSFVPGSLALCYLGAASLSNVNIGVRHVLPVVPLGLVAAAGVLATLLARRRLVLAVLLAVLVLASATEAFAARGREIPFGNLLVGGPSGTRRVLTDSNVDWGESQGRLYERAARGDLGRVAVVSLAFDAEAGGPLGLALAGSIDRPRADSAAVSVFLLDLAHALKENREDYPKISWIRGWLVPLVDSIEERAVSAEPVGDAWIIYRLGPPRPRNGPGR